MVNFPTILVFFYNTQFLRSADEEVQVMNDVGGEIEGDS